MHKPTMSPMTPVNGFVAQPNGPPPPPNSIPYQFQSNMIPGQNAPNQYSSMPLWNVTQVEPQHFTPTTAHQWNAQPGMTMQSNPNYIIPQLTNPTSWLKTFEKGKPKALGIVLIITAICQIVLGIVLPFISLGSITFYSGIEYWSTVFYIITGSLTISAQKRQSISQDGAYVVLGILLLLNLLVFCVTVSSAVFGGRALDQMPSNVHQVLVIQNVAQGPPSAYPPNTSEFPVPPNMYTQK
ncbi:uncharacterized protein LOC143764882 isoform X2 [Ranitomeya variabilis]|uniref:uncharacterized protein LOC143764882 isoform X2 n=1 Tax=Ranitomeya variabilis TaxID=490064 RepID=UPI004055AF24